MKNKTGFLILILFFLSFYSVFPYNLNVSPARSLSEIRDQVRSLISGGITEDIFVLFAGGFYYMDTPVVFNDQDDSNPSGNMVYYENSGDDDVFIAGGREITGWVFYNGIYYANVDVVDASALFENRERGIEVLNPGSLPVEDIIPQLNSPGKYYYHTDTRILYYNPRNNPVSSQCIFIPEAGSIIELRGSSDGSPIQNITFRDLIFIGTKYNASGITNFYNETGLIYMENAEYITIDSCELIGAGVSGIVVDKYAQHVSIVNNRVDDFNLHGISLRGYMPGDGGYPDQYASYVSKNNFITNNFIVSGAKKSASGSGIRIIQSGNNFINKNRIRYISGNGLMIHGPDNDIMNDVYYGIRVISSNKWSFLHARDNSVTKNDISRITPGTKGGGIYLFQPGQNNTISNNCIHDIYINNTTVTPTGIYIGDFTDSATILDNIIHTIVGKNSKGRALFASGNNCTIENNVFSGYGPYGGLGFDASNNHARNLDISENIFYKYKGKYIYSFDEWDNLNFRECNRNVIYHPDGEYQVKIPSDVLDIREWRYDKQSSIDQDPSFEEPESHYYSIQSGSPAAGFNNIDQNDIGIGASYAHRYARDIIEAEDYIRLQGMGTENRATTIRSSSSGDSTRYGSVYFDNTLQNVEIKLSCDATGTDTEIEIRLGSSSGPLLCTIPVNGTGGITSYRVVRSPITLPSSGVYDVYLRFGGSMFTVQVDWFRFYALVPKESDEPINLAPHVTIETPVNNNEFPIGTNIVIAARADDPDGTIVHMELFIDEDFKFGTDNSSFSYTWQDVTIGPHVIRVVAEDDEGSRGEASVNINVRNNVSNPPTVEILEPENGQRFRGPADIRIRVTAQDTNHGIRSIEIQSTNLSYKVLTNTLDYTWKGVKPGDYTIKATAVNNAGISAWTEVFVWVDAENYLIAHYMMESIGAGGHVQDYSGNENHAVASNDVEPTSSVEGQGGAYYFNGTASVESINQLIDARKYITITGWIKPETGGTRMGIFGQTGVLGFGFLNELMLSVYTDRKGGLETGYPEGDFNTWHHIAVVGNGDEGLRLYYDGSLKAGPSPDKTNDYGTSRRTFKIGGGGIFGTTGDAYFKGSIDEVRVYWSLLSETEIKSLASKGDNIRPDVKIISPPENATFEGSCNIPFVIEAYDRDGYIDHVDVYYTKKGDNYPIDTFIFYPDPENRNNIYEGVWYGVAPGKYILTARAVDNEDADSTHSISFNVDESQPNPVAYWSFNEGDGDIAHDSENGHDGDIYFAEWSAEGMFGSCLFFDGYGRVEVEEDLCSARPEFTLAYWMKPTAIKPFTAIMGQYGAFISSYSERGNIAVWVKYNNYNTFAPVEILVDEWVHIATVGTGQQLIIYIDGKAAATVDANAPMNYGGSSSDFKMGWLTSFNQEGPAFQGYLDEVYYYKRALEEHEIKLLATPPEPKYPSLRIISPENMSRHVIGKPVYIQAQVVKADLTGVYLELYISGMDPVILEEPYTTDWIFEETGDYTISLTGYSDNGYWAGESVTITILTEEEAEELDDDEDEDTDDDDLDDTSSDPEDETDPYDDDDDDQYDDDDDQYDDDDDQYDDDDDQYDDDDDQYDDDEYPDDRTTWAAHASEDEILQFHEGKKEDVREGETLVEYIERLHREKGTSDKNDGDNGNEEWNKDDDSVKVVIGEDGKPVTGPTNPPDEKGDGKIDKKENNGKDTNSASTNFWSGMFGDNKTDDGENNSRPGFIYVIIFLLVLIAVVIASAIIVKKILNRKKRYYYYE